MITAAEIRSIPLDHLGIAAGLIDKLKLVERLDARLPILNQQQSHLSHGQRIKAMILNGLGFTQNPIYLTPKFFADKPIELLIGEGVKPEHLNDDALGRTLDRVQLKVF